MLEESRMDKKSLNRSSLPQSRASAIDCKKSTDLTHKPWPRNNKKREGSGSAPKNEPYRKRSAPAQGGRGQVDRRPRTRGGPPNFLVGGTENTGIEDDDEPEIGSVFVPGSKKQNLNHLLNFMYPSRGAQDRGPERRGAIPRRPVQRVPHRLEHDLYLRANCQFVVREDGDYKANLLDPDVPVKWEQVEEIVVRSTGRSECPICLGAPAAGRVGRCGHVYCWACALHYAHAHDKQPPPCPVCANPLLVAEMRPTKMLQWDAPADEVTMRLVRRLRGSTTVEVAPPRGQIAETITPDMLPVDRINDAPYTKFFTVTKQQVREILERERKEIQDQIMAEIDTTEIVYLEQALEMLKAKEEKLNAQYEQPKLVMRANETPPIVYEKQETNHNKVDWFDMTDDGPTCVETIQDQVEDIAISLAQSNLNPDATDFVSGDLNDNQPEEFPLIDCPVEETNEAIEDDNSVTDIDKMNQAKYFYFYQADDGQQVFLNSLNVRILNASWGALAAAPPVIKGRVLHRETLSLGEQMRKHMPYTAHLPLYCSFDIVELDLQPPFVTKEALKNFAEELDRRARTRARMEREERRRERAYRRVMEGPPKPDLSSELMFPAPASYSPPAPAQEEAAALPAAPEVTAASPPGPSFAKMASTSGTWRVRRAPVAPPPPAPDEEGEGSAPRALSLSDAIEAALLAAPKSAGKKKKHKHTVVFATGMQRTNDSAPPPPAPDKEDEGFNMPEGLSIPKSGGKKKKNKQTVLFASD